jgi:hypothetical protein
MRTNRFAIAAVLAVAALSANAQAARPEPMIGPFTYDVLGATPSLTFGRKVTKSTDAPKPAAQAAGTRTSAPAGAAFTYEALGATPHVELKKPEQTGSLAQQPVR